MNENELSQSTRELCRAIKDENDKSLFKLANSEIEKTLNFNLNNDKEWSKVNIEIVDENMQFSDRERNELVFTYNHQDKPNFKENVVPNVSFDMNENNSSMNSLSTIKSYENVSSHYPWQAISKPSNLNSRHPSRSSQPMMNGHKKCKKTSKRNKTPMSAEKRIKRI